MFSAAILSLLSLLCLCFGAVIFQPIENDTPIIGILAQETAYSLEQLYPNQYKSFIAASYVKFIEGGGARVVPIWIDRDRAYYEEIMNQINGVLFPGGSSYFNKSNGYAEAGRHIYDIAVDLNNRGDYFPLWGTCLGFELMTFMAADGVEHREDCKSDKQPLPLIFKPGFRTSKMFADAPDDVVDILTNEPVTANFHQYCVTEQGLRKLGLNADWTVNSVNDDWDGLTFVSTIESKRYPFYGVQFHPEKNIYEWIPKRNISHTKNAITAAQYFAEFVVAESRKSSHTTDQATHISKMDPDFAHVWTKNVSLLTKVKSLPTGCKSPLERSAQKRSSGDSHPVANDFTFVSKDTFFVQTCTKAGSILKSMLKPTKYKSEALTKPITFHITSTMFDSFASRALEQQYLIYNFPVTYTGIKGNAYEECYLFTADMSSPGFNTVRVK